MLGCVQGFWLACRAADALGLWLRCPDVSTSCKSDTKDAGSRPVGISSTCIIAERAADRAITGHTSKRGCSASGEGGDEGSSAGSSAGSLLASIQLCHCHLDPSLHLSSWAHGRLKKLDLNCPACDLHTLLADSLSHLTALTSLGLVFRSWGDSEDLKHTCPHLPSHAIQAAAGGQVNNQVQADVAQQAGGPELPAAARLLAHSLAPLAQLRHLGLSTEAGIPGPFLPCLTVLTAASSLALQHAPCHPVLDAAQFGQLLLHFPHLAALQLGSLAQSGQLEPVLRGLPDLRSLSCSCIHSPNTSLAQVPCTLSGLALRAWDVPRASGRVGAGLRGLLLGTNQLHSPLQLGLLRVDVQGVGSLPHGMRSLQADVRALQQHYQAHSQARESSGRSPRQVQQEASAVQPGSTSTNPPSALATAGKGLAVALLGCSRSGKDHIQAVTAALADALAPHISHLCMVGGSGVTPHMELTRADHVPLECVQQAGTQLGAHVVRLDVHWRTLQHLTSSTQCSHLFPLLDTLGIINAVQGVSGGLGHGSQPSACSPAAGISSHREMNGSLGHWCSLVKQLCGVRPFLKRVLLLGREQDLYRRPAADLRHAVRAAVKAHGRPDVRVELAPGLQLAM